MIWLLPGVVVLVLAGPVVLAVRRCASEASALRGSLASLADLSPSVRQLQLEAAALVAEVPVALRRRSVVAPIEAEPVRALPASRR